MEIRKLTLEDLPQAMALGAEAFGAGDGPPPPPPTELPPGRHTWGAYDGDRLVAKVVALEFSSWWGGAAIATCGIAGVAVAAEHRSGGLLARVFEPVLAEAASRGEHLSTLYPTANGIYRPLGYELVTSYDVVEVPTADLARVRPPTHTRTRRATAADVPALKAVYDTWAAAQAGPLTRTGPRFSEPDEALVGDFSGLTLAVDETDAVVGFASWDRSGGYGPHGLIEVWDLLAVTADAYRALWTVIGSFASVTGTVRLRTSGADPARLVLPTAAWASVARHQHPYMLRVSDVAGALGAARRTSTAPLPFAVAGDRFGADGGFVLDAEGCRRSPDATAGPTFTPQGLALAFAGVQTCANLRLLEHLTGPDHLDPALDAALSDHRPVHVRDYF